MSTYDPDELVLSKRDVIELLEAIEIYWNQNTRDNLLYLAGVKLMKQGIKLTPEKAVKKIWNTFLKFILVVQYENALQKALKSGESWGATLTKIKIDIARDGIDKAMKKYSN